MKNICSSGNLQSLQGYTGVYILEENHSPPPYSEVIFSPIFIFGKNLLRGGGKIEKKNREKK